MLLRVLKVSVNFVETLQLTFITFNIQNASEMSILTV
jgi:hypothetical protein